VSRPAASAIPRASICGLAAAAIAVAGARVIAQTRHYGFVGLDTLPLLARNRVQGPGDVLSLFSEPLLGAGFHPWYYRPVFSASLALDHALWGLDPLGAQITGVLCYAACGALLYALCRALAPVASPAAALLALAVFLLHPVHWEVLPAPARRPDYLALLFSLASLTAQARAAHRGDRWPPWPAVFAFLAFASKETSLVLPLLSLAVAVICIPASAPPPRLRAALRAVAPVLGAAAAIGLIRLAVLGSPLGGRPTALSDPASGVRIVPLLLLRMMTPAQAGGLVAALAFGALALGASDGPRRARAASASLPLLGVAAVWLAAFGALYSAAGGFQGWYALLPTTGLALAVGGLAALALDALAGAGVRVGLTAGASLVALLGTVAALGLRSPLVRAPKDWALATQQMNHYLAAVDAAIDAMPRGGGRIEFPRKPPLYVKRSGDGPTIPTAFVLSPAGVEAWLQLAHPDRSIRIEGRPRAAPATEDDLVIVLGGAAR
jgi:hypothetical protein